MRIAIRRHMRYLSTSRTLTAAPSSVPQFSTMVGPMPTVPWLAYDIIHGVERCLDRGDGSFGPSIVRKMDPLFCSSAGECHCRFCSKCTLMVKQAVYTERVKARFAIRRYQLHHLKTQDFCMLVVTGRVYFPTLDTKIGPSEPSIN